MAAPDGYHYLGEVPRLFTDNNNTVRCTQLLVVSNDKRQNERYSSYFTQDSNFNCYCALGCKKTFKRFGKDFKNVLVHLRNKHPEFLVSIWFIDNFN